MLNIGRKRVLLALFSVLIIGLLANAGFAQQDTGAGNFLNNIFEPFAGINLAETYDLAPNFIDAMFYFLFFIGVAQFALSGYFKGKGGTAVIIAFGAALAIGLAIWTSRIGFRLGDRIGPIAGAIFAILFFVLMVRLFKGEGKWGPAFWIAYLFGFIFINFFVPEVFTIFNETKYGRIAIAIANLLFFIALIYGVPSFLSKFWGGGEKGGEPSGRGFGDLFRGRPKTPEEERREEEARNLRIEREQKQHDEVTKKIDEIKEFERRLEEDINKEDKAILEKLDELRKLLIDLEKLQGEFRRMPIAGNNKEIFKEALERYYSIEERIRAGVGEVISHLIKEKDDALRDIDANNQELAEENKGYKIRLTETHDKLVAAKQKFARDKGEAAEKIAALEAELKADKEKLMEEFKDESLEIKEVKEFIESLKKDIESLKGVLDYIDKARREKRDLRLDLKGVYDRLAKVYQDMQKREEIKKFIAMVQAKKREVEDKVNEKIKGLNTLINDIGRKSEFGVVHPAVAAGAGHQPKQPKKKRKGKK